MCLLRSEGCASDDAEVYDRFIWVENIYIGGGTPLALFPFFGGIPFSPSTAVGIVNTSGVAGINNV